ncbi:MAG TPA: SDR family oxidoreductase [Bryobacteraceae bacterium]|jgi:NAD(P)-dependent dehydrogenase (short-subunit alcohol dehydrogenase family)|nr:SDR family oxidoreductase [Bryobacteraceae bacterium]
MSVTTTDPKKQGPKPPFEQDKQTPPGSSKEMRPQPDYGEQSYKGLGRLKGRKAIVTGGDSGIGRAVALAFAREGADVLISYLNEHEDANETARLVRDAGRKAVAVPGNIEDVKHCEQIVERAFSELGGLDILINNAAHQKTLESIDELTPEEWDYTFKTNIYAMFYLSRFALPRMKQGSTIVNTTSVQAYQPNKTLLAYATTKGAIVTFTKALSSLAIKQGIRVNAVAPGPVWTPLIPSTMPEEKVKEFGKNSPMERPAQPAELAPIYVFLCSDESRYITGGIFDLTGGRMLP